MQAKRPTRGGQPFAPPRGPVSGAYTRLCRPSRRFGAAVVCRPSTVRRTVLYRGVSSVSNVPSAVLPSRSIACTENSLPLGQLRTAVRLRTHAQKPCGSVRLLDDLSTDTHAVEAIESSVLCRCGTCPSRRRLAQCGVPGPIPRDRAAADGHGAPLDGQRPTCRRASTGAIPRHVDMGEGNPSFGAPAGSRSDPRGERDSKLQS